MEDERGGCMTVREYEGTKVREYGGTGAYARTFVHSFALVSWRETTELFSRKAAKGAKKGTGRFVLAILARDPDPSSMLELSAH
jgi:hypothetical protein